MRDDSLNFLRRLVETGGPSGYEQSVQRCYREYVASFADSVTIDCTGNANAVANSGGSPRLMLAGHADEIGLQVRYISDEGFIYFAPIGGWDAEIAVGQRVNIHTGAGDLNGVIGKRAIHLMDAADRKKKSELDKLWIDIGVSSREDAEKLVAIADPITIQVPMIHLQGSRVAAKSFDNRMAVWMCAEVLRLLHGEAYAAEVHSVSTTMEEIGLRGAHTSAYGVDAPVGVAFDVTHSTDYPDVDKRKIGDIRLGRGPVLSRGPNINPRVLDLLIAAAEDEGLPYQLEAANRGTGTDANAMQLSRAGMATGLVSVPLRYMHTPTETLDLDDLENAARLVAGFIRKVTPETSFTP